MNFKPGEQYRFFPKDNKYLVVFGIKEAKPYSSEMMKVFGNLKTLTTKTPFEGTVISTWENGPVVSTKAFDCLVLVNKDSVISQLIDVSPTEVS